MVLVLLWVGTPTRMSTSPTLMSWPRKSSVRKLSSANLASVSLRRSLPTIVSDSSQPKPVKLIRTQGQQVWQFACSRKNVLAEHFDQNVSFVTAQIQFDSLRRILKIIDHQDLLIAQLSHVGQYSLISWIEKLNRSAAESASRFANGYQASHPVEKRVLGLFLRKYVDCRITINWILYQGRVEFLWIGGGKTSVPASAPLHWSSHSIAVAQINVVTHSDFVAVINAWSTRQRHQHPVHQLDSPSVVVQQRGQSTPNSQVQPHRLVLGVAVVHIVAFYVGEHFQS